MIDESSRRFLETLLPDLGCGFIEIRAIHPLDPNPQSLFYPSLEAFSAEQDRIDALAKQFHVYFGVCPRSRQEGTKNAIKFVWCLWADVDAKLFPGGKAKALKRLREFPLPPTAIVDSGHGFHPYWKLKEPEEITGPEDVARLEAYLKALAHALGADPSAAELARILRLPGTQNLKDPSTPLPVTVIELEPNRQYNLSDFEAFLNIPAGQPNMLNKPGWIAEALSDLNEGNRNSTFAKIIGRLHHDRWEAQDILTLLTPHSHASEFPQEELRRVVEGICHRYPSKTPFPSADEKPQSKPTKIAWPDPPDDAAYYGLAGQIVRVIEPHSEADPIALLVQLLLAFGNVVGRGPHAVAEDDLHGLNLFAVLVGETSKGRKGTAWGRVKRRFETIDQSWVLDRVASGLSSGEGLIWEVRDPITKWDAKEMKDEVVDKGVLDKRLMVYEPELGRTLRAMGREGSTLSGVIRQAWDSGILNTIVKNSPARSKGAHISIIGHITRQELLRYLNDTETANGFANRFLFVCVKRSKSLPEGGKLDEKLLDPHISRLKEAFEFARNFQEEMKRDEDAKRKWAAVYDQMAEGRPGLLGAILARAEALVMRLSCVYALLDMSSVVKAVHLEAAIALWEYCEASARYIFGESLGYPLADTILKALRTTSEGMTRTDIQNFFGRNRRANEIDRALGFLLEQGLVRRTVQETQGRPSERWFAI